jgi:hypothetical protein
VEENYGARPALSSRQARHCESVVPDRLKASGQASGKNNLLAQATSAFLNLEKQASSGVG